MVGCNNQAEEPYDNKVDNVEDVSSVKITVQLDWKSGAEHAFLYAGKFKDFFKEERINLEIVAGTGSSSSANMIDAKTVDFALCSGETALQALCAEIPRKLIVIAVFYPNTPTEIYSFASKKIHSPEDLYGKKLGIMKGSSAYRNYKAFAKKINLDRKKINEIPSTGDLREIIGESAPLDAMVHFGFQHPLQLRMRGYEVSVIKIRDFGIKIYGQSLIAHPDTIINKPKIVTRIVRAIQKSYLFAIQNPEEVLNIFNDEIPGQDIEYAKKKLEWVNNFVMSGIPEGKPIGYQDANGWSETYDYLKSQGQIFQEVNLKEVWTDKFLDDEIIIRK